MTIQKGKNVNGNTTKTQDTMDQTSEVSASRDESRPKRRKVYERVREGQIPNELHELFAQDGYDLRLIRWAVNGEEDYRYLNRRENEGYEFVTKDELPSWYLQGIRMVDTKSRRGLVTIGDLCLMKVDSELRQSRRRYYQNATNEEVAAVDIHVLEKKGFVNNGTRSKVYLREPTFQE